jgi:hypothetical protein
MDRVMDEVQSVNDYTRALLAEYVAWGGKIKTGEIHQWMYNELIDFVNFRMETAHSCLQLIEQDRIADALGLSRSLLENYLLLILMCRGHKYFRLQDRTDLKEGEFKDYLLGQQEELKIKQEAGTTDRLAVQKYPRAKRHLMHIYEGVKAESEPMFMVSAHYFHFKEFRPEVMRLKQGDYFEYVAYEPGTLKILKGHQEDAIGVYKHYLSYDALLTCLELNSLADHAAMARIEAHYTFLGQFLHPTDNAARELHESSNVYHGKPAIGMDRPYSSVARLLASLYVCYLVAGVLDEIASLHDNAPRKFISEPGTEQLHSLVSRVSTKYSYFWFLFNDPPLYDKFIHCVSHATEDEVVSYGHYSNAPNDLIMFNQSVYGHLKEALNGWHNVKVGTYTSPLQ